MFSDYIGIPFLNGGDTMRGSDCFGLVRLVYKEVRDIKIFKHNSDALKSKDIEEEYLKEASEHWSIVDDLELFDVIAMARDPRIPNIVQHFGIYIGNGKMLHTLDGVASHVARVSDYKYCVKSFHRYKKA